MARPRKYIRIGNREITGVSRHSDGRYYIIDASGKRVYFRDRSAAIAAYRALQGGPMSEEELAQVQAATAARYKMAHERPEAGQDKKDNPVSLVLEGLIPAMVHELADTNVLADRLGIPSGRAADSEAPPRGGKKLSDVLQAWRVHKLNDFGDETQHIRETTRRFKLFIKTAGNVSISNLTPQMFREYHGWALRRWRSSPKAYMDNAMTVKAVITQVRRKYPEWPWPVGVTEWAEAYDRKRVKVKDGNREPMPPEVLHRLVQAARKWAVADVDRFPEDTQAGRAKRLQAMRGRREGRQLDVILRLCVNCALDPIDVCRLQWEHLKLDAGIPHLDFPRQKVSRSAGQPVRRLTPLLPPVVTALRAWRVTSPGTAAVFRTARGAAYSPSILCSSLHRLKKTAGDTSPFTFKHLRNVLPTLGRRAGIHPELRDAVLGHVQTRTGKYYEADLNDPKYLLPLVTLLEQEYIPAAPSG